jgi:hypothetical protein
MVKPKTPHPNPPPHAPVSAKVAQTLATHPQIVSAADLPPPVQLGAPFKVIPATLHTRAGKTWAPLVRALAEKRNLTEAQVRLAFVETERRLALMKPTISQLKGTFNEIVLGHAPERCAARTKVVEAALFFQLFDVVAGRASFFTVDGLTGGGLAAVPLSAGRVLTLDDLPLSATELAALKRQMKRRPTGPPSPALYDFALELTDPLHAAVKESVIHVRDWEIDGSEFIDQGSILPLREARQLLVASEEYKTAGSGGGTTQSAVKLNRIYEPGISGTTPLTAIVTNNLPLAAWTGGPPGGGARIDTTMGRLVVPATADGPNQVLIKATKGPVDRAFVRDVLRGKGLVERKAGLGEIAAMDRKLETRIHVELLQMPGREIEAVFEALIRNR